MHIDAVDAVDMKRRTWIVVRVLRIGYRCWSKWNAISERGGCCCGRML
jgi:hypothetical protein